MAEPGAKATPAGGSTGGPSKPPKAPNPVWTMMGLPNIRMKLPSRNWMIFLSITGSWTAAVMYDRREKKRIQKKWAKLVSHIAQEHLDAQRLPRKLSVFISAPPADGLVPARDHFHEYVKPILVAAALDWDAVEGRREGDVRAGLAEKIRRMRNKRGEVSREPVEEGLEDLLEATRQRAGVKEWDGPAGDIVIGRHTWKEYVRGMHEGWLGPMDPPTPVEAPTVAAIEPTPEVTVTPAGSIAGTTTPDDASPSAVFENPKTEELPEKPKEEETKKKKKIQPPPFNTTADYEHAALSPNCPRALGPTAVVPLQHLLGFWNFPIRMYRYLNRRKVADEVGRETAAAVLGVYRPFEVPGEASVVSEEDGSAQWEQQRLLAHEESGWHKTARERKYEEGQEKIWLSDMVLDPRIAERMRRFVLDADVEERAKSVTIEKEGSWFNGLWPKEKKKALWEGLSDD